MGAGGARTKESELAKQAEARMRPHAGGQDKDVFDMSGSESDGSSPRIDALHTPYGSGSGSSTKRVPAPAVVQSQRLMLEEVEDKSSTSSEASGSPVRRLDFDDVDQTPVSAGKRGYADGGSGDDSEESASKPKRMRKDREEDSSDEEEKMCEDSSDEEEKSMCARCLRDMAPRPKDQTGLMDGCVEWEDVPECGHKVCGNCWVEAVLAVEEARTDKKLKGKMLSCCGLDFRVCLKKWPLDDVVPVRQSQVALTSVLNRNLPSKDRIFMCTRKITWRPQFQLDFDTILKGVRKVAPGSITAFAAQKIRLKRPKHSSGSVELQMVQVGAAFYDYPPAREHPKAANVLDKHMPDHELTYAITRSDGLDSFFDTDTGTYLPLPKKNAVESRIAGEPAFKDDGSPAVACSKCGRFITQKQVTSAVSRGRNSIEVKQLFQLAMDDPRIGVFCCSMMGASCKENIVQMSTLLVKVQAKPMSATAHVPPAKSRQAAAAKSSAGPEKSSAGPPAPVKIEVVIRAPVCFAERKKGGAELLPNEMFSSASKTTIIKPATITIHPLHLYRPFYENLTSEALENLGDHEPEPPGKLWELIADACHAAYRTHLTSGTWHAPKDDAGDQSKLCRLFLGPYTKVAMVPVWNEDDIVEIITDIKPERKKGDYCCCDGEERCL